MELQAGRSGVVVVYADVGVARCGLCRVPAGLGDGARGPMLCRAPAAGRAPRGQDVPACGPGLHGSRRTGIRLKGRAIQGIPPLLHAPVQDASGSAARGGSAAAQGAGGADGGGGGVMDMAGAGSGSGVLRTTSE